ncbi:MAG: SDR family NAD(P)-dependent oxidoreductase [Thermodesulfobacteriota bacterium]
MEIKDRSFIVTGGAAIRHLIEAGGKAAAFDLADEKGEALAAELGENALYCHTDVADEASVEEGVQTALSRFGAVHGVINCAGIGIPAKVVGKKGPMPLETFTKTIQINLVGTFNVIRLAAARMMENSPNEEGERGVTINTASMAAYEAQLPFPPRFGRPAEYARMVAAIRANPVLNGETIRLDSAMRMQAR